MEGAIRPRVELLAAAEVERIVSQATEVLASVGIFVENDPALALLHGAGQRIDAGRVRLSEAAIHQALGSAPRSVTLHDRGGEPVATLGGDEVCFDPGSAALFILDPVTGRRRSPVAMDAAHMAWVTAACKHVKAQSTALVPSDVPEAIADRYRLYLALRHGTKPIVTGTFRKDGFAVMKEMLVAIRGDEARLRAQPLAIFDCCPTPPLKWSDLTCQALIDAALSGIPVELVSMPLGGATAPVTLREMVVQHTAENMSGVLIHQLAAPGAPIIWGGSPAAFDMRHGTTPMGAIETMMVDMAYAQVGKRLGLPTHAYMALSDAKSVDWQAGMETGAGAMLAALAGINMVSGPGMLDYENCQSLEKLVLDNEVCGMAIRLSAGISTRSAGEAVELLRAVALQGQFLGHPHTRKSFRAEVHMPGKVIDRLAYDDWIRAGAQDAFAAARAEVDGILARGNPSPLPDDLERELGRLMRAEAARFGCDRLPAA